MKIYKKIMNALAAVEKIVLVISTLLILVLTVGNVFSRKVIHRSWSFTEELVVAVFVLITLLAAALACREGELVSLTLVTDRLPKKLKKPSVILITVLSIIFSVILFKYGMDKVITQLQNGKRTFVLNWPEWIFWSFVPLSLIHIWFPSSASVRKSRIAPFNLSAYPFLSSSSPTLTKASISLQAVDCLLYTSVILVADVRFLLLHHLRNCLNHE